MLPNLKRRRFCSRHCRGWGDRIWPQEQLNAGMEQTKRWKIDLNTIWNQSPLELYRGEPPQAVFLRCGPLLYTRKWFCCFHMHVPESRAQWERFVHWPSEFAYYNHRLILRVWLMMVLKLHSERGWGRPLLSCGTLAGREDDFSTTSNTTKSPQLHESRHYISYLSISVLIDEFPTHPLLSPNSILWLLPFNLILAWQTYLEAERLYNWSSQAPKSPHEKDT